MSYSQRFDILVLMIKKQVYFIAGVFLVVILSFIAGIYLTSQTFGGSQVPFFPEAKRSRIGGIAWEFREFNPEFREVIVRDNNIFVWAKYTDYSGISKDITIRVGSVGADGNYHVFSRLLNKSDQVQKSDFQSESELKKIFRKGQRIKVRYLVTIPDYQNVIKSTTLCSELPYVCETAVGVVGHESDYQQFGAKNELPVGVNLNALILREI